MAFSVIGKTWDYKYRADYVLDSDDDVSDLPTDVQPGSTAVVANSTGHVYMLSPSGTWRPFGWSESHV